MAVTVGLQQGVLSHAQGSAYIESGSTKVMVGVFGPHESDNFRDSYAPLGRVAVDVSIVTFPSKPKVGPRKVLYSNECYIALHRNQYTDDVYNPDCRHLKK